MTRRFKKTLLVLLLGTFGLGLFRGWFVLKSTRHPEDHKLDVKLTIDPDKAKSDAELAQEKMKELAHKATQKDGESQRSSDDHKQSDLE